MTVIARITTAERDAEVAEHIRAARLEIDRVLQRIAKIGNLVVARQRLNAALAAIETTEEIMASEG